jgi:hypothetical protein
VAILGGAAILLIGVADHVTTWPMLIATPGPTAYLLLAHPDEQRSRIPSAVVGHGAAIAAGCAALWLTGSWTVANTFVHHSTTLGHAFAAAIAVAITLFALGASRFHHAPAGATAVLVGSGLAEPGQLLAGLAMGLVALLILVLVMDQLPGSGASRSGGRGLPPAGATGRLIGVRQEPPR